MIARYAWGQQIMIITHYTHTFACRLSNFRSTDPAPITFAPLEHTLTPRQQQKRHNGPALLLCRQFDMNKIFDHMEIRKQI